MANNTELDERKSNASLAGNLEKKPSDSKTCLLSNEKLDDAADPKKLANQQCKKSTAKPVSKPAETELVTDIPSPALATADTTDNKQPPEKLDKKPSETCAEVKKPEKEENPKAAKVVPSEEPSPPAAAPAPPPPPAEASAVESDPQKKIAVTSKSSETSCATRTMVGSSKVARPRADSSVKRPSEIPKLKSLSKASQRTKPNANTFSSKLPVKTAEKELEQKKSEETLDGIKAKTDQIKPPMKPIKIKKEPTKPNDKIKVAMSADFNYLVPLYEKQFKKISDVWVNTIYCSLTMRTNLVKLLFQAFPNINREQFYTEDEKLLHCITHAKSCTKLEAESLVKYIKALVTSREKTKDEYGVMVVNKEIADCYNHDWRKLIRKVTDLGEEAKILQIETPELLKKKEANETSMNDKIKRMEINLSKKEEEIRKLANQLNILRQKESAYKENVLLKIPDYEDIKADVNSLISTQKEFDELRAKYLFQNYTYEKKIKDLENLLEEKKKVLEKERDVKRQLQGLLIQLQAHQERLTTTVGKEQVDFVMGRSMARKGKRREQLWLAAVNLVIRGFLVQMKKLERDRNKMLLELQANDLENIGELATIVQKDNFIKSIRQQMFELQKMSNC